MDEAPIAWAKQHVQQRAEAAALDEVLEATRVEFDALARTAASAAEEMPGRIERAVHDGLREQTVPMARNLAELRGLMNHVLRRLERLEGDSVGDRHARVDDLSVLVDLISSGWNSVDARLTRIETALARSDDARAVVYRIDDRRPASSE